MPKKKPRNINQVLEAQQFIIEKLNGVIRVKGCTQETLADACSVSQQTISRLLVNTRELYFSELVWIAKEVDLTIDEIINWKGDVSFFQSSPGENPDSDRISNIELELTKIKERLSSFDTYAKDFHIVHTLRNEDDSDKLGSSQRQL